jgi:hypothetical protein
MAGRRATAQTTSGGGFFRTIFFLSTVNIQPNQKKKIVLKKTVKPRRTQGSDRVKTGNEAKKKRAAIFLGCSLFCLRVVCGTELFSSDWNSPAEQRKRPKRDRFIASVSLVIYCLFDWVEVVYHFVKTF